MSAAALTITGSFTIPVDHPALPGHFPGNPVVPGVVVLANVIRILESAGLPPASMRSVRHVKFIEPLLPGQKALITVAADDAALSFGVTCDGRTIAKGAFGVDSVIAR
jgi:3-hydroxymyristoyl/3-hydroxydecanoyl-(acyl carrier protein) dehydratase